MEKNLHELQDQLGGPRNNNHEDQNEKELVSNEIRLQGLRAQSQVNGNTKS
jgi:hypothetical protein